MALVKGNRGLSGGSSLAQLLAEKFGARNQKGLARLTEEKILEWADRHHERTGQWPRESSGVVGELGETWSSLSQVLRIGGRGLPGGSTLARLLAEKRGVPNRMALQSLSEQLILEWADIHFQLKKAWPSRQSGPVLDIEGEDWKRIDWALRDGSRGLSGGSSLAQLLKEKRGVKNSADLPPLSIELILEWATAHYQATGTWPRTNSGPVIACPTEKWVNVNAALQQGGRGLPGGQTLARLLAVERGSRA